MYRSWSASVSVWTRSLAPFLGGLFVLGVLAGHGLDVDDAGPRLHDPREQRELLAERVPLELGREVDVAQVGVALEGDAEHLVGLALVPGRTGVDVGPRGACAGRRRARRP